MFLFLHGFLHDFFIAAVSVELLWLACVEYSDASATPAAPFVDALDNRSAITWSFGQMTLTILMISS
jgi:hypothetical protein